jgi:ABC-type uncharacterized transport system fused permease/ATPase subunit
MCKLEANRAYFDLKMDGKLDNPDQRICEDVSSFVRNTVDIIALLSSKFLNVIGFAGVLWYEFLAVFCLHVGFTFKCFFYLVSVSTETSL